MKHSRPSPAEHRPRDEHGAAVVDFVLVSMVLVPLVLGLIQVGLVLHVRNTLAAAATEGARYGANIDRTPADGAARTREQVRGAIADRFAGDVTASRESVDGVPTVVVRVHAVGAAARAVGSRRRPVRRPGHGVQETAP